MEGGQKVVVDGDNLVVGGLAATTLQNIQRQLDAEQNGIPLAEYFRTHAITVATFEELQGQEGRDRTVGKKRSTILTRVAAANYVDNQKALEIYYFDNHHDLRFIGLPFNQITEFRKVTNPIDGSLDDGTVTMGILTRAGFIDVRYDLYPHYKDMAEDVAEHRDLTATPRIEF